MATDKEDLRKTAQILAQAKEAELAASKKYLDAAGLSHFAGKIKATFETIEKANAIRGDVTNLQNEDKKKISGVATPSGGTKTTVNGGTIELTRDDFGLKGHVIKEESTLSVASAKTAEACTGNANTASKLATGVNVSLSGDVTGTVEGWDGSKALEITATVADNTHNHTMANVTGLDEALKKKVDVVSGSRLMKDTEGTKLEGIETGAQANKIETISVTMPDSAPVVNASISGKKATLDLTKLITASAVDAKIAAKTHIVFKKVKSLEELPGTGAANVIYLVPATSVATYAEQGATANDYVEYIWLTEDKKYESLGLRTVDLSDYYTIKQTDAKFATQDTVTGIDTRVSGLEATVGDSGSGLVKDVNALKTTLGEGASEKGLVADVKANTEAIATINGEGVGSFKAADKVIADKLGEKTDEASKDTAFGRIKKLETAVGTNDSQGDLFTRIAGAEEKLATMATDGTVKDIRTDLGNKTDGADAEGSAFARVARNKADIAAEVLARTNAITPITTQLSGIRGEEGAVKAYVDSQAKNGKLHTHTVSQITDLTGTVQGIKVNSASKADAATNATDAARAAKLGTSSGDLTEGSLTRPVYFEGGVPKQCTYTIQDNVPASYEWLTHPTGCNKPAGLYNITVDGHGHVTAATAVTSNDILDTNSGVDPSKLIANQVVATADHDGLMSKESFKALEGRITGVKGSQDGSFGTTGQITVTKVDHALKSGAWDNAVTVNVKSQLAEDAPGVYGNDLGSVAINAGGPLTLNLGIRPMTTAEINSIFDTASAK